MTQLFNLASEKELKKIEIKFTENNIFFNVAVFCFVFET